MIIGDEKGWILCVTVLLMQKYTYCRHRNDELGMKPQKTRPRPVFWAMPELG